MTLTQSATPDSRATGTVLRLLFICLSVSAHHPASAQTVPAKLLPGATVPAFPEQARAKMVVGDVVFRAKVTEQGTVESVDILQVPEKGIGFEEAVSATVMSWKFEPAQNQGASIPWTYVGKIGFSLRPEDEKGIKEFAAAAEAAWNRGDASKFASQFDNDGHLQWKQDLAKNAKEVKQWASDRLGGDYKGTLLSLGVDRIDFFPDSDLAKITPNFSLGHDGAEGEQPMRGELSIILLKEKGKWSALCAEMVSEREPSELQAPKLTKEVEPVYPEDAKKRGTQGTVVLRGTVDKNGSLGEIEVLRSIPGLDDAALDAVKQWEFEPAVMNGEPMPMVTTMAVSFIQQ